MYYFGYAIAMPGETRSSNFNSTDKDSFELKRVKEFTKKILDNIPFIDDIKFKRISFPPLKQLAYLEIYIFLYVLADFIFVEQKRTETERKNFYKEINDFLLHCADWNLDNDKLIEIFDNRLNNYAKLIQLHNNTLDAKFYTDCFSFQTKLFSKELIDKKKCLFDYDEILSIDLRAYPQYRYCLLFLERIKHHLLAFMGEFNGINTEQNKINFIENLQKLSGFEKYKKILQVIDRLNIEDLLAAYSLKLKETNKKISNQFVFNKSKDGIQNLITVMYRDESIDYPNDTAIEMINNNSFYNLIDFSTLKDNSEELFYFMELVEYYRNIWIRGNLVFDKDDIEKYKEGLKEFPFYNETFVSGTYPFISKINNQLYVGYFEDNFADTSYILKKITLDNGPIRIVDSDIGFPKIYIDFIH